MAIDQSEMLTLRRRLTACCARADRRRLKILRRAIIKERSAETGHAGCSRHFERAMPYPVVTASNVTDKRVMRAQRGRNTDRYGGPSTQVRVFGPVKNHGSGYESLVPLALQAILSYTRRKDAGLSTLGRSSACRPHHRPCIADTAE